MCKDWFSHGQRPVKDNSVYNNQHCKCFHIHPRLWELGVYKKHLLPSWNQENASNSQRWKTLATVFLTTVHHCLFLRPHHSWIHGEIRFKTRKWRRQFVFFRRCHQWVSGATVVVMSETASINIIFAFSQRWSFHYFIWPTARVIVALLRRLHRSR